MEKNRTENLKITCLTPVSISPIAISEFTWVRTYFMMILIIFIYLFLSLSFHFFFQFAAMIRVVIAILNTRGTVYRLWPAAIAICK